VNRSSLGFVSGLLLAACAAAPEGEDPLAQVQAADSTALVVPFGATAGEEDGVLAGFYANVLERMHEAYGERDANGAPSGIDSLQRLLLLYRNDGVPGWAKQRMDGFAAAAEGAVFERHVRSASRILVPQPVPLGENLVVRLQVDGLPGSTIRLGGEEEDKPFFLSAWFEFADTYVDGSTRRQEGEAVVRLPRSHDLTLATPLELPLELGAAPAGAVRRKVAIRIEMLPGHVGGADMSCPVRRAPMARGEAEQLPLGADKLRAAPLASLREAMAIGDAQRFPAVYLSACFLPPDQRREGMELLVQWVRLGRPDQARVAMAALRELSGEPITVGDRERWLAWWQRTQ
jgi:hypothetical protein